MPRSRRLALHSALAIALLGAPIASGAASLPFTGSLSIEFGGLPPISMGGGGSALVNGSAGGAHASCRSPDR